MSSPTPIPGKACPRCLRTVTAFWGPGDNRNTLCVGGRCAESEIDTPYGRQANPTYLPTEPSYD